jgi:hypothetical protein
MRQQLEALYQACRAVENEVALNPGVKADDDRRLNVELSVSQVIGEDHDLATLLGLIEVLEAEVQSFLEGGTW